MLLKQNSYIYKKSTDLNLEHIFKEVKKVIPPGYKFAFIFHPGNDMMDCKYVSNLPKEDFNYIINLINLYNNEKTIKNENRSKNNHAGNGSRVIEAKQK